MKACNHLFAEMKTKTVKLGNDWYKVTVMNCQECKSQVSKKVEELA